MTIEADSVCFYGDAASKEGSKEVADLLLRIAGEEKKHFNIMENLYDFVIKPEYFLTSAEFSNLNKEL